MPKSVETFELGNEGCVTLDPDKMITNNLLLSRDQRYPCRPELRVINISKYGKHRRPNRLIINTTHIITSLSSRENVLGQENMFYTFPEAEQTCWEGRTVNTTSSCYNALNTIKCMQRRGLRGCFTYVDDIFSLLSYVLPTSPTGSDSSQFVFPGQDVAA